MEVDQPAKVFVAEASESIGSPRSTRRSISGPCLGIGPEGKCLAGERSLAPDLGSPRSGGKLGEGGHSRVRHVCREGSKGVNGAVFGMEWSAHGTVQQLEIAKKSMLNQARRFAVAPMMDWTDIS